MLDNIALDVFIGLVFIFLLYSLLASIIQEMIATRLAFRAKVLEKAILRMLEDGETTGPVPFGDRIRGMLHLLGLVSLMKKKKVAPWFYAHPLIKYLAEDNYYSKPAYLDAANFSKVVMDLLKGFGKPESQALQSIHDSLTGGVIHKLPINISGDQADKANPAIKVLRAQNPVLPGSSLIAAETVPLNINTAFFLRSLWQDSGADIDLFRSKLEQWFNDTMARASGWYKKYTRLLLFLTGLIIAYVFNVDTIAIHRILSTNKTAREQLVQMAISHHNQLDPSLIRADSTHTPSDSLLQQTYQMVTEDASATNNILGLGRVWKDTCKLCEDSLSDCHFIERLKTLEAARNQAQDSIISLVKILDLLGGERKILLRNGAGRVDSAGLKQLNEDLSLDSIRLAALKLTRFPEYERMKSLEDRCAYVSSHRAGKWNLYAPLQHGGWETFFGWLITAMAITLGAPFWFDLLSKLISLRGSASSDKITGTGSNTAGIAPQTPPVQVTVTTNPGEEAVG